MQFVIRLDVDNGVIDVFTRDAPDVRPLGTALKLLRGGVGEVRTVGADAGLVIEASWAVNRRRRWTHGAVRLSHAADAERIATVVAVPAEAVNLTSVEPDVDLSW